MNFNSEKEYAKYLRKEKVKVLGEGAEGRCYLLKNNTVLKDFFGSININEKEKLLQFKDIELDSFSFTKDVCINTNSENIYGAITNYAEGINVDSYRICDEDPYILATNLEKLVKDIVLLTEKKVFIMDNFLDNIVYDGKKFTMIDTQGYDYFTNEKYDLLGTNLGVITRIYIKLLGSNIDFYLKKNESKYMYYCVDHDLLLHPKETLIGIKEELEKYLGKECTNYREIRENLVKKLSKK